MQTILGAGGSIGNALASELAAYTTEIRLVSRNPKAVNKGDQLMAADLTRPGEVLKAVEGSDVVYLTVGLEYKLSVWQSQWPVIMQNTIDACKTHGAGLVFFDNVYMYDRDYLYNMTEDTPVRPSSKKGEIRARLAAMLMDEVKTNGLKALIARSADFLGPKNSIASEVILNNFRKGKKANWLMRIDKIHSQTYVADAAKGTAILGNTPGAFGEVWHLPTPDDKLTGKDWIDLFAREMKVDSKVSVMPGWMLRTLGLFIPMMKELGEMAYQYDRDYFFNSSKFKKKFSYEPLSPEDGVRDLLKNTGQQR